MATAALALAGVLCGGSPAEAQSVATDEGVFDTLSLFVGPEGSKQPQDLGINANMGLRVAANWGFPLSASWKLGGQLGAAANVSDAAVHVLDQIEGPSRRTQTFLTFGVFQRPSDRFNWGIGYDVQFERYYDHFQFGQWRGQGGYGVTTSDDVGVWFTKSARGENGLMLGTPVRLDPISQINGYHRHTWNSGAQTTVWAGIANHHHNVVWVFPDNSRDSHVLVYGAELTVPLSERFAIHGATNLVTPAATGTVDAYLGVSFYPGRGALRAVSNLFAPIMSVVNNTSMPVDLRR
jgi:hypothetical protein